MVILGLFISVILFILADLGIRYILREIRIKKKRREREAALAVSLQLDFTREAKTLKRVEVADPVARILCVDDEEVILDSFRKILVLDGYCVDTVQTGQEALGLIQTNHYDFVFTDLKMPAMDGLEVVKAVKHMRPDIDVVIITGYATVESAVEGMKQGALDYVQKPFTEEELLAFVKKALIRRQDRIQKMLKPVVHISHIPDAEYVRRSEFSIPGGVFISAGHCWANVTQEGKVKVGLDDFAKKLIGPIDAIDFPNVGMSVREGQPLFSIRQKNRRVAFLAPVSGKVVRINNDLAEDCDGLEMTTYNRNWVCVIDADHLDSEIPNLKVGKAAVAYYQEEIERFRAMMKTMVKADTTQGPFDESLYIGELSQLSDADWDKVVKAFFLR